jgi:hypothetical protein
VTEIVTSTTLPRDAAGRMLIPQPGMRTHAVDGRSTAVIDLQQHTHSARAAEPWTWRRSPVFWGLVLGLAQVASPLAFSWLPAATVLALQLCMIAGVYVGFAVADGRPHVIAVESLVVGAFVVLAAVSVTTSSWVLVAGYVAHGLKDAWQHRSQFVANTRWWPPFCAAVDFLVAAALVVEIAAGVRLH